MTALKMLESELLESIITLKTPPSNSRFDSAQSVLFLGLLYPNIACRLFCVLYSIGFCFIRVFSSMSGKVQEAKRRRLGFMDLPQGVRPFSKDQGKEHEDKTSLRNIELPIHRYSQRKMKLGL